MHWFKQHIDVNIMSFFNNLSMYTVLLLTRFSLSISLFFRVRLFCKLLKQDIDLYTKYIDVIYFVPVELCM